MKKYLTLFFAMFALSMIAQTQDFKPYYKFRVQLKDKLNSPYSILHPEEYLSEKSIARRNRQHLPITQTDIPVNQTYVSMIKETGVKVLLTSKWNNTVLIQTYDSTIVDKVKELPCVTDVRWVATYSKAPRIDNSNRHTRLSSKPDTISLSKFYGSAHRQIEQLNGIELHNQGYRGQGMTIAVIDAGFYNADIISSLSNIQILGTRDFVGMSYDIYGENSHGMMVLSCIGTDAPGIQVGTAPYASFWLLRSEDSESEQLVEEDYWASAVEFADSVGVDVINSSLGYSNFDAPAKPTPYHELDGKTHLNSRSASLIASKGMILCNSAGNSGDEQWKLIGVPADAPDILAVGAVDESGMNTNFSSIGIVSGSKIKPDVCAMGGNSAVMGIDGRVRLANGTSFSSPILTGMVACLWQALPNLTSYQIMDIIRKSSNNADHPDNVFGYGIPDFAKALELGRKCSR